MQVSYNVYSKGDFAVHASDSELPSIADKVRHVMNIDHAVKLYSEQKVVGTIYATPQNHAGVEVANMADGKARVAFLFADIQGHKMLLQIAQELSVQPPQSPELH